MINKVHLKNFKAHSDTELNLSNINILTGLNGLGKSSVIQALLLLRQSKLKGLLNRGLDLNGDLVSIGSSSDCIYQYAETDVVGIHVWTDHYFYKWEFSADLKSLSDTFMRTYGSDLGEFVSDHELFNNNFQYISAFRNGPTNDYDKDTSSVELLNQISRKEGRCELVAHFYYHFKDNIVNSAIARSNEEISTLKNEVEYWLREISPNINIHVNPKETSFNITYSYSGKDIKTNQFKASNIGFGVSYVLPIIVAILQACSIDPREKEKDANQRIIIIENPEAHIHPTGQAKLMELICLAAKNGVQFIIETHSDHIINGLLVAVKKGMLTEDESQIFFFDRETEFHTVNAIELTISQNGKIKKAPKGFFDQLDNDMATLMGF